MNIMMMFAFAQMCLMSVFAGETCKGVTESLESSCHYENFMTLVSGTNHLKVDKENCNSEYEKSEWQAEPKINFAGAKHDKSYTVLCVDPDPPGYEKGQYWLHWLVSNVKGEDLAKGDLSHAKHSLPYYGPAPPEGSGLHRYIFLAFEQENDNVELDVPNERSKFLLSQWLEKHSKLCGPAAGIQFKTKY